MKVLSDYRVRKKLIEMGYTNFKEYCDDRKIDYQKARYLISGLLDGSRSEKAREIKNQLIKDFGKEIFREV